MFFFFFLFQMTLPKKCNRTASARSDRKTDSVISSDSDIRFTRRKLGDSQKCGCAVIAGFLIFTLFATITGYIGCKWNIFISKHVYSTLNQFLFGLLKRSFQSLIFGQIFHCEFSSWKYANINFFLHRYALNLIIRTDECNRL